MHAASKTNPSKEGFVYFHRIIAPLSPDPIHKSDSEL